MVTTNDAGRNDARELRGWMMYDWANSAFPTTVLSCLLGPYLTGLAQADVGENGAVLALGGRVLVTAKSLFPLAVSASVLCQVFLLPILGAVADYSRAKKRLMAAFTFAGAGATVLLFAVDGSLYLWGGLLLVIGNLCFGAATVLYNAFLPEIATPDQHDRVSSRGYALGYLGGGLLLAGNLALVSAAPRLGLSTRLAVRLSLLSAGLWWAGFAVVTLLRLKNRAPERQRPEGSGYLHAGWSELARSVRELCSMPHTLRYLVSYLFFNDGIQTVVAVASVVLAQELFVAQGRPVDTSFLMAFILMVQFVAFVGALAFEWLARAGTKNALLLSLLGWCGVVVYASIGLRTTAQAWAMGSAAAVVLGGSQALARSLFSRMIPAGREAAFFGLYEVSDRGSSWMGPLLFGIVVATTGSYRQAMLSLIVLFAAGTVLLILTDTRRAMDESRGAGPPRAAAA
jgi:UMF1 family MFS transporter